MKWTDEVIKNDLKKKTPMDKFLELMKFLGQSKQATKYHSTECRSQTGKQQTQTCYVTGKTFFAKHESKHEEYKHDNSDKKDRPRQELKPCLACNRDGVTNTASTIHPMKSCAVWDSLSFEEKKNLVTCTNNPFDRTHAATECTKD